MQLQPYSGYIPVDRSISNIRTNTIQFAHLETRYPLCKHYKLTVSCIKHLPTQQNRSDYQHKNPVKHQIQESRNKGLVIAIIHEYALLGKGTSIHYPCQLEAYKNNMNDKSVHLVYSILRHLTGMLYHCAFSLVLPTFLFVHTPIMNWRRFVMSF